MSGDAEKQKWAALEGLVDAREAIALEVMREVFARLPYGEKFTLSDGSVAHLQKSSEPELCPNEHGHYFQCPQFGVDMVIEGGMLDHIEISAFQTGAGMAVGPGIARQKAKADDGNAPERPRSTGGWAAAEGRGNSSRSASQRPRNRPDGRKAGGSSER